MCWYGWFGSWEGGVASAALRMRFSQASSDKDPVTRRHGRYRATVADVSLGATERSALMPNQLLHHGRHQERSCNLLLGDWRLLRSSCLSLHLLAGPTSRLKGTHLEISVASSILDQLREPFLPIVFPIFTSRKCVCQVAI